jgi:hypothetical protein
MLAQNDSFAFADFKGFKPQVIPDRWKFSGFADGNPPLPSPQHPAPVFPPQEGQQRPIVAPNASVEGKRKAV